MNRWFLKPWKLLVIPWKILGWISSKGLRTLSMLGGNVYAWVLRAAAIWIGVLVSVARSLSALVQKTWCVYPEPLGQIVVQSHPSNQCLKLNHIFLVSIFNHFIFKVLQFFTVVNIIWMRAINIVLSTNLCHCLVLFPIEGLSGKFDWTFTWAWWHIVLEN